jgi:hypothetical protein
MQYFFMDRLLRLASTAGVPSAAGKKESKIGINPPEKCLFLNLDNLLWRG